MLAKTFEELRIWQEARILTVGVYQSIQGNKDYGFKDQIQRASVSIMNNIAEGFESGSDALFVRYLRIAKGSAGEVRSMLLLAQDLHYVSLSTMDMHQAVIRISQGIQKLIEHIEKRNKK